VTPNPLFERLKTRIVYLIVTSVFAWVASRFAWIDLPEPQKAVDWILAAGTLAGLADWVKLFKQHGWGKLWEKISGIIGSRK
jgi:hypothetical protein